MQRIRTKHLIETLVSRHPSPVNEQAVGESNVGDSRPAFPVILIVDLEPLIDAPSPDAPASLRGCNEAFDWAAQMRRTKPPGSNATFTWALRMDPQIEVLYGSADHLAFRFEKRLAEARGLGDELGLHTHFFRWAEDSRQWRVEHSDADWIEHCIRLSFEAYRHTFGVGCETYRGGDRWTSPLAMRLVEELGTRFDLTPERGSAGTATLRPWLQASGSIPDYLGLPNRPFRPSASHLCDPGPDVASRLWVIPLSGGQRGNQPQWRARWKRLLIDIGDSRRLLGRMYAPYTIRLTSRREEFLHQLMAYLEEAGSCYLALAVRSSSFVSPSDRTNLEENMKSLFALAASRNFVFTTPARAISMLGLDVTYREAV